MIDFFVEIGHIKVVGYGSTAGWVGVMWEGFFIVSNLLLFSFATPDLTMAGAAIFAMLSGIVLMGGRSVVGLPLRAISSLYSRGRSRKRNCEAAVCLKFAVADRRHVQNVRGVQQPLRRAA